MVTIDYARTIVGILGNIIALFLFLSPAPTFIKIWKNGSVERFSAMPYLATFINCMLWVLYGLPIVTPHSTLLLTINSGGIVIELVFLTLFIVFSDGKKRLKVIIIALLELIFVAVLALLVLTLVRSHNHRTMVVGTISTAFNVVMYASPLSVMRMVIRTKSVEYMPFCLSLGSFANGACWLCYACLRFDPFVAIPNGLGTVFSAAQLIIYATYYKSTKQQLAARKGTEGIDLSPMAVSDDTKKVQDGVSPTITAP